MSDKELKKLKNMSDEEGEIIKRLDILINLTLKQQKEVPVKKGELEKLVKIFYGMGLEDYKKISNILEVKNPISVANILTKLKEKKKSKFKAKLKEKEAVTGDISGQN